MGMNNRIKELRETRGLTARELAKMVHTSPSQISRLEKSKRKLSIDWILRISGAMDVPPNEVVDINLGAPVPVTCDQALMGTIIGFLFEACDKHKIKPPSKQVAAWITFMYNDAVQHHYSFPQMRELANTIVKVNKGAKPEKLAEPAPLPQIPRAARKKAVIKVA